MNSQDRITATTDNLRWDLYGSQLDRSSTPNVETLSDMPVLDEGDIALVRRYQQKYTDSSPAHPEDRDLLKQIRSTLTGLPTPRDDIVPIMRMKRYSEGGFTQSLAVFDDPAFANMVEELHDMTAHVRAGTFEAMGERVVKAQSKSWGQYFDDVFHGSPKKLTQKISVLNSSIYDDERYEHKLVIPDIDIVLPTGFKVDASMLVSSRKDRGIGSPFSRNEKGVLSMHVMGMIKRYFDISRHPQFIYENIIAPFVSELGSNLEDISEKRFEGTRMWYSIDASNQRPQGLVTEVYKLQSQIADALDHETRIRR